MQEQIKTEEEKPLIYSCEYEHRERIRELSSMMFYELAKYDLDVNLYNLLHINSISNFLKQNKNNILAIVVITRK